MAFLALHGRLHVTGYAPDGDSIRFAARSPQLWPPGVGRNQRGHAQLRIEGIDTLETHYQGQHQPPRWAHQAERELLRRLGITDVAWNDSCSKIERAGDNVPATVLTRRPDGYGRPIAFLFPGTVFEDGARVFLDEGLLAQTVNYQMLASGLAYPMFYENLFADLRRALAVASQQARSNGQGLWPEDRTREGAAILGLSSVTDAQVLMPKLFRRLVNYFTDKRRPEDLSGFLNFLKRDPDPLFLLDPRTFQLIDEETFLHELIRVSGDELKLPVEPERLVFREKG